MGACLLLLAVLWSTFTSFVVFERRSGPGQVNSSPEANSHTVHRARAESNYKIAKALMVSGMADLLIAFIKLFAPQVGRPMPTHLLGVGAEEVAVFRERFRVLSRFFPDYQLLEREDIARMEPALVEGRDPSVPIVSLYSADGFAVDFQMLAEAMIDIAVREAGKRGKTVEIHYNTEVTRVERTADGFALYANGQRYEVGSLEIAAGNSSLLTAKALGFGLRYTMITVGGSYYVARNRIRGKVYKFQREGMQNAAVHVDEDVNNPDIMRFGPTADLPPFFLPFLERGSYPSILEYARMGTLNPRALWASMRAALSWKYFKFGLQSFCYKLPLVGKLLFTWFEAQKLIPGIRSRDLTLVKGAGGIRGQLVDMSTGTMADITRIEAPEGMPCNCIVAPSPGASACFGNALLSMRNHARWQNQTFDEARMRAELGVPEPVTVVF